MIKYLFLVIACSIALLSISIAFNRYLLPVNLLNYFPSYSENSWERPHNYLLIDPLIQFEPWRHFSKDKIFKGEFPLWNDENSHGVPFFANPQTAVLYPLNFFYYIFPPNISLTFIALLKIFFYGLFTYIYLRKIKIQSLIAFLSSCMVALSPFMIMWIMWPHTNVLLMFPLLLYLVERIKDKSRDNNNYFVFSIVTAIAIFGGHPEMFVCMYSVVFLYIGLRLKSLSLFFKLLLFSIIGLILSSIQTIPFIEYILNSYIIGARDNMPRGLEMSIGSYVLNIFPYLLGAPHEVAYKNFSLKSNFQEDIGGYIGSISLVATLLGFYLLRKNSLVRAIFVVCLIGVLIVYRIFPFNILLSLPFVKYIVFERIIGLVGFLFFTVFAILINNVVYKNLKIPKKFIYALILLIISVSTLLSFYIKKQSLTNDISQFILSHLVLIAITLILGAFNLLILKKKKIFVFTLFILISLQIWPLFYNYNYYSKYYYPTPDLIKKIQSLPKGPIIEIGNPNLHVNTNLIYSYDHILNHDVLGVRQFQKEFEKNFPNKNMWGNPENISQEALNKLKVKYIVSDFDIRLKKVLITTNKKDILPELIGTKKYVAKFKGKEGNVKQIRFITANYNRLNSCRLRYELKKGNDLIKIETSKCVDVRNYMFITIPFEVELTSNNEYTLEITSSSVDPNNGVSFLGEGEVPYVELLFDETSNNDNNFSLLYITKSTYLFEYNNYVQNVFGGEYVALNDSADNTIYKTTSTKSTDLETSRVAYPGWEAFVDNRQVNLILNLYLKIKIPKGEHIVEFVYKPLSFYLGIIVSSLSLLILVCLFARKYINKKIGTISYLNIKNIKFYQHVYIFSISFVLTTMTFVLISKSILISFKNPFTTAINWNTTVHYIKIVDYFYYVTGFVFVYVLSLSIWVVLVWYKNKK